jgi:hypothetical protein
VTKPDPTSRELAASLRRATEASVKAGDECSWVPAHGSMALPMWRLAANDLLALTIVEADTHAVLVVRSALEHTAAVAESIARERPFLPHSIGRTAVEHALRAMHYLDDQATDKERAARRLNELLYAIEEAERLNIGVIEHGYLGDQTANGRCAIARFSVLETSGWKSRKVKIHESAAKFA